MAAAVAAALETAPTLERDQAAVELAKRYATLIDDSAVAAKYRSPLQAVRAWLPRDEPKVLEAYNKIADALSEHSVASDLGPKLLAVLTSLGMTAAGRSAKGGAPDGPRVPDELGKLRAERDRQRGAG
jgi:hypothetical protein